MDGDEEYMTVVAAAHKVATALFYCSWERCLEALEGVRWMAGQMHPDWLIDYD